MIRHAVRLAAFVALLGLVSLAASAPALAQAEWIAAVRDGGHVIIFRHGATH